MGDKYPIVMAPVYVLTNATRDLVIRIDTTEVDNIIRGNQHMIPSWFWSFATSRWGRGEFPVPFTVTVHLPAYDFGRAAEPSERTLPTLVTLSSTKIQDKNVLNVYVTFKMPNDGRMTTRAHSSTFQWPEGSELYHRVIWGPNGQEMPM